MKSMVFGNEIVTKLHNRSLTKLRNTKAVRTGWYSSEIYIKTNRYDPPTYITYDEYGFPISKEWFIHGQHHRINNRPAKIEYYSDGRYKSLSWYKFGGLGRDYGPVYISFNKNGIIDNFFFRLENLSTDLDTIDLIYYWIKEKNIIFTHKNNYEIPDEYKAEFRLMFL